MNDLAIITFEQQISEFVKKNPLPAETKRLALVELVAELKKEAETNALSMIKELEKAKEKEDGEAHKQNDEHLR